MLDVPQRNYMIVGILGLTITVIGWLLGIAANRIEATAQEGNTDLVTPDLTQPLQSVSGPNLPPTVTESHANASLEGAPSNDDDLSSGS